MRLFQTATPPYLPICEVWTRSNNRQMLSSGAYRWTWLPARELVRSLHQTRSRKSFEFGIDIWVELAVRGLWSLVQ